MNLALSLRHFSKRWGLCFSGLLRGKTDCSLSTNLIGHLPPNGIFVVVGARVVVRGAVTVVEASLLGTVVVKGVVGFVCSLDTVVGASHLYLVVSGHVLLLACT